MEIQYDFMVASDEAKLTIPAHLMQTLVCQTAIRPDFR